MRHQRVLIMNDRNRAVRVADQAGADRSEQAAREGPSPPGTDDDHLGLLGQIDQGRNDGREQQLAFDLRRPTILSGALRDLDSFVKERLALLNLPSRKGYRRRQRRLRYPNGPDSMHDCETNIAHRGLTRCPIDRVLGGGGSVDADQDTRMT